MKIVVDGYPTPLPSGGSAAIALRVVTFTLRIIYDIGERKGLIKLN